MQWRQTGPAAYGPAMPDAPGDATAAAVADAFGVGRVTAFELAARGSMGRVFHLSTPSGEYAAKEFFWHRPTDDDAAAIVAFADACRDAGVASPRSLVGRSGAHIVDLDGGAAWSLQEWADGGRPRRTDVQATRWLMRQAAVIHRLGRPAGEIVGDDLHWYCRVGDAWDELQDAASTASAPWAGRLAERVPGFRELAGMVNEMPVGAAVQCHRDLQPANTLTGADGAFTLIDWDNAGPHEPWREIGNSLLHSCEEPELVRILAADYRAAGGFDLPRGPQLFATGVAVWLNFLQGQIGLTLDEAQAPEHRAHAADKVAGMVEGMPTLRDLESAARLIP